MAVPAVALPVLRSSPLLAAPAPRRLVGFYTGNGTILDAFWPSGTATNWTVPAGGILEVLAKWKAKTNVLYGVNTKSAEAGPGSAHQKGVIGCWTCGHALPGTMNGGNNSPCGYADRISIDQYIASKWGPVTRLPTLAAGVRMEGTGNRNVLSYLGSNQPVFPTDDPAALYARVFGSFVQPAGTGATSDGAAMQLLAERKSVLDYVSEDLTQLSARLPGDERVRLERHLESLRDLERQIAPTVASGAGCSPAAPATIDPKAVESYPMVTAMQINTIFMALACDQTRLPHLMWSGETSQQTFPWLGFSDPHHTLSHMPDGDKGSHDKLVAINRWYAAQIGSLLEKMDGVTESNGKTMLDNSVVMWTNGLGKGNNHTRSNIPYVLVGSAGGALATGRYLQLNNAHNDLMISILHAMGLTDETKFGDPSLCKGPLPGLAA
jgi:hypothetical protein